MPTYLTLKPSGGNRHNTHSFEGPGRVKSADDSAEHHLATCEECAETVRRMCAQQMLNSPLVQSTNQSASTTHLTLAIFWLTVALLILNIILKFI